MVLRSFRWNKWVKRMPARRFLELGMAERFTNRRPTHYRAMKMVSPEPERFGAISRWSSAATPPDSSEAHVASWRDASPDLHRQSGGTSSCKVVPRGIDRDARQAGIEYDPKYLD